MSIQAVPLEFEFEWPPQTEARGEKEEGPPHCMEILGHQQEMGGEPKMQWELEQELEQQL